MNRCGGHTTMQALVLLFLVMHLAAHSLVFPRQAFVSLQEDMSPVCAISAADEAGVPAADDFKPPKHSFVDYTSYFCPDRLVPLYLPREALLCAVDSFRAPPPAVYFEIFVPPQNLA
jgi:hypothetical protein